MKFRSAFRRAVSSVALCVLCGESFSGSRNQKPGGGRRSATQKADVESPIFSRFYPQVADPQDLSGEFPLT